jgi:MFS family permease
MGLFQGPMSPVNSQLARDWMPRGGGAGGVERAWAQRFVSFSHNVCPTIAAFVTPRIAERFGWRSVCYSYALTGGSFLALWRLFASNKPKLSVKADAQPAGQDPQQKQGQDKAALFDWRILRTRPSLALGLFHLASDIGDFTRHQLGPTIFLEKFGCSPVQVRAPSPPLPSAPRAHAPNRPETPRTPRQLTHSLMHNPAALLLCALSLRWGLGSPSGTQPTSQLASYGQPSSHS